MPWINADVAIFSSPTEAFGNASGELYLEFLPGLTDEFPWLAELRASHPAYFTGDNATIDFIMPIELPVRARVSVSLVGIMCDSATDARQCASIIESLGLHFYEYSRDEA